MISRSDGFTIIELFAVVLIVGVLAAIALPRFASVREEAHFAAIQQDLRNLGASQERYHQSQQAYAQTVDELDFAPSAGVQVDVIPQGSDQGWAATAIHAALDPGRGCAMYLGDADPPPLPNGQAHAAGAGSLECTR